MLTKVAHPFIVGLICAFQTQTKLYLVMPFVAGGELFYHIQSRGMFLESEVRYVTEVCCCLSVLYGRCACCVALRAVFYFCDYHNLQSSPSAWEQANAVTTNSSNI